MRISERAYIAGIFDGEGCVHFRNSSKYHRPVLQISQRDPAVLEWIQKKLGFGNLYRIRARGNMWVLVFASKQDILAFIPVVYPHSIVKRRALKKAWHNLKHVHPEPRWLQEANKQRRVQKGGAT